MRKLLVVTQNLFDMDDLGTGIPSDSTSYQIPVLAFFGGNFSALKFVLLGKMRNFANEIYQTMSRQEILPIITSFFATQPVTKAWLFGSFSRGEERPDSDVDILVKFDKDAHISLLGYAGMVCELERLLHRNVDLVEDGMLLPFAASSAEHDKILIYERAN